MYLIIHLYCCICFGFLRFGGGPTCAPSSPFDRTPTPGLQDSDRDEAEDGRDGRARYASPRGKPAALAAPPAYSSCKKRQCRIYILRSIYIFFSTQTCTFQLLDTPWSQVSSLLPPGSCTQFLSRIGLINPTARRFFVECWIYTSTMVVNCAHRAVQAQAILDALFAPPARTSLSPSCY